MLSNEQWSPWLNEAAGIAYQSAGHVLHPSELEKGQSDPSGFIAEHSGIDPDSLAHLSSEEAGNEFARGIRRSTSEMNAIFDEPEMRFHMDLENFNNGH